MTIEEVEYGGWKRNLRLAAGGVEAIITLEVGPRILRYGFEGETNLLKEYPEQMGKSGEPQWMIRGGHRFWTAPEGGHSYAPDNFPVQYQQKKDDLIEIELKPEDQYGFQKTLRFKMDEDGGLQLHHTLRNLKDEPLDIYPWALTVLAPGGKALIPQPVPTPHPSEWVSGVEAKDEDFWPNRRLILWPYTHLNDPRFDLEPEIWAIKQEPIGHALKIGTRFELGWVAYQLGEMVFCKEIPYENGANYPDDGSNLEVFTNKDMLEVESVAPARAIPVGSETTHTERWRLKRSEDDLSFCAKAKDFLASLTRASLGN